MEKKTIILEPQKRVRMFTNDVYIGSISNLFEPATINIEYIATAHQYAIDYYFKGVAVHFWCDRYEVENESENN